MNQIVRALAAVERGDATLALDYDGTLAPFKERRDEARPAPELAPLLAGLANAAGTRVAIVSGRPAHEVVELIGIDGPLEVFGAHGWEHLLPDGTRDDLDRPPEVIDALDEQQARIEAAGLGEHLERKAASLALHWRGVPAKRTEALRAWGEREWAAVAASHDLEVLEFDGGIELRHAGRTKADVMRAIAAGLEPGAALAYLGDDETDEDAFRALREMEAEAGEQETGQQGGGPAPRLALLVAAEPRPSHAHTIIQPRRVAGFLSAWLQQAKRAER